VSSCTRMYPAPMQWLMQYRGVVTERQEKFADSHSDFLEPSNTLQYSNTSRSPQVVTSRLRLLPGFPRHVEP
jgi:hypothetical protein